MKWWGQHHQGGSKKRGVVWPAAFETNLTLSLSENNLKGRLCDVFIFVVFCNIFVKSYLLNSLSALSTSCSDERIWKRMSHIFCTDYRLCQRFACWFSSTINQQNFVLHISYILLWSGVFHIKDIAIGHWQFIIVVVISSVTLVQPSRMLFAFDRLCLWL